MKSSFDIKIKGGYISIMKRNNTGFKLICNNCGNIVEIKHNTQNKDYKNNDFSFYSIQEISVQIECNKCENVTTITHDGWE